MACGHFEAYFWRFLPQINKYPKVFEVNHYVIKYNKHLRFYDLRQHMVIWDMVILLQAKQLENQFSMKCFPNKKNILDHLSEMLLITFFVENLIRSRIINIHFFSSSSCLDHTKVDAFIFSSMHE